jgi:hypothetical protein
VSAPGSATTGTRLPTSMKPSFAACSARKPKQSSPAACPDPAEREKGPCRWSHNSLFPIPFRRYAMVLLCGRSGGGMEEACFFPEADSWQLLHVQTQIPRPLLGLDTAVRASVCWSHFDDLRSPETSGGEKGSGDVRQARVKRDLPHALPYARYPERPSGEALTDGQRNPRAGHLRGIRTSQDAQRPGPQYPNAASDWRWSAAAEVFPQETRWKNIKTGQQGRHHVHETIVQRAVRQAAREARIVKHVGCHTFRHSGVYPALCGTTHLLECGYDIRTVSAAAD